MEKTIEYLISGRVQGVGFRYQTNIKANKLGLVGFVENLSDGRVKIIAKGEENKLEELKNWIKQGGVKFARVSEINTVEIKEFEIKENYFYIAN
ncbi:MAG: acylphosphatase [Cardiobacteriaceae bacterium]|nr:acylphosphatase [Cardiobacteriaceae bacterium]